jgi:hypothetical protein
MVQPSDSKIADGQAPIILPHEFPTPTSGPEGSDWTLVYFGRVPAIATMPGAQASIQAANCST